MDETLIIDKYFNPKPWHSKWRRCKLFPKLWKYNTQTGQFWYAQKQWMDEKDPAREWIRREPREFYDYMLDRKKQFDKDWAQLESMTTKLESWKKSL